MKIIPAIDIQNGNCVRLRQGDFSQETIFNNSPLDIAEKVGKRRRPKAAHCRFRWSKAWRAN